ncbi:MAG TPA: alcohol dehydrogenase catalytic domain-containing protein [Candidatus Limnocylindrales bacterium]|nr:alcohol dehydrogenase catalytic domain-containing protein [Candidatus Limnocylindrales bacterium]
MRAVRWHARNDVRLDDIAAPQPGPGQVLLRVEAAAICGTDVDEVRHGPVTVPVAPHPVSGRFAPITLGHEIVGVVEAAPGSASGLELGSRVAPWPSQPCGRCRECLTGHENRCPSMVSLGMSLDGGMADQIVVDASRCVPIDAAVAMERAVLVEPFAVALHALHLVDVVGRRVAVVGIGSLGLCVVEAAARAGAATIIAVARSEHGRVAAREAGADTVASTDESGTIDAEIAFETAGAPDALGVAAAAVRRGGRIVVLGGHVRPIAVDLLDVTVRELCLQGSVSHCFADFAAAARAIEAGELATTQRDVQLAPLEDGPELLRTSGLGRKRILVPSLA